MTTTTARKAPDASLARIRRILGQLDQCSPKDLRYLQETITDLLAKPAGE